MDIIFLKTGEYRNDLDTIVIIEKDVKDEKIFNIFESNAKSFIRAELAILAEKIEAGPKELTLNDVKKLTLPKLLEYAEKQKIDLGDAEKKPDVLEAILRVIDPESFKEKDLTFEDVKDFNIDQLKVFTDNEKIDLGEAKTQEEILKVIEDYFESEK